MLDSDFSKKVHWEAIQNSKSKMIFVKVFLVKGKLIVVSILSILSVSLFPILFMDFNNIGKVQIGEIVGITGFIVLIALALLAGNYLFIKDIGKAALITNLFMIGFLYFVYIEKVIIRVIPMFRYWHVALICLFLLAHLWYLIRNKLPSATAVQINQGLLVIFTGLILYNGIVNVPQAINKGASEKLEANQNLLIQSDIGADPESKDLPNVYYFIFDEYAGYDGSLRYCDYDNSSFYNSLEELGFVTSRHSVNKSVDTYIEIPNLLQLQEINSAEMSDNDKKKNFKNPYLVALMKKNGYLINLLDTTNYQFLDDFMRIMNLHLSLCLLLEHLILIFLRTLPYTHFME